METKHRFDLPKEPLYIIEALNAKGFRADIVGGPVRDFLLGKAPDDYDVTTDATPEEVKAVFFHERVIETGIKHGTVTLVKNGANYEITTYRIDGEYKDSRHPESVSFTKRIEEDLARRDFTMNAIAYNPKDGVTDPFFGKEDIRLGIIRAVGEPELRFTEDALRILRGARFSSRLGFVVEEKTKDAMQKKKELLHNVSSERIYTEWKKLLSADYAHKALSEFSDIIGVFLPELSLDALPEKSAFDSSDYMTRLVSLFYLSKVDSTAFSAAMKRLKTDSETRDNGATALLHIGKPHREMPEIGRLLFEVGESVAELVLSSEKLLGLNEEGKALLGDYLSSGRAYKISHLAVGGNDLSIVGASGRQIGELLKKLLFAVIEGKVENEKETLLALAENVLKGN